jgi:S1-C subfamily serine protease
MDATAVRSPQHRRISGLVQTVAIVAVILLAIVALNWPITFARVATSTPSASNAQLLAQEDDSSSSTDADVADVAAEANPAVVTITNYRHLINPDTGEEESGAPVAYGVGSGYIIDAAGHVVTNNHVTERGAAFEVQFYDGTTVDATLVGSDPFQDVAVLQLDLEDGQTVPGTVSFGDSDSVRAGDHVIAIGSPYGEFLNSVSDGSVSAVDRSLDTELGYPLINLIQHSAPIYEGNSGGPLLNMAGEVIGMNVAKVTESSRGLPISDQEGIGFAIASDAVKSIVDQIIEKGTVARSYLGIVNNQSTGEVVIESIVTDGPADQAGMKAGDIITEIDGQEINQSHSFLNILMFDHKPGDTVEITVLRDGEERTLTATLGERPANLV